MLVARERFDYIENPPQKVNRAPRVKKRHGVKRQTKVGYFTAITVFLVMAFFLTARHAQMTSTSYELIALKKQAQSLAVENQALQSKIDKLNALENIEYIATVKLGMQKPEAAEGVQFVPVEYSKAGAKVAAQEKTPEKTDVKVSQQGSRKNFIVQALAKIING